jgi:alpha-soluble NSF attachment protein
MSSTSDPVKILAKAETAKNHKGWFGGNKLDEAAELYSQAATGFKLQKNLQAAAAVFHNPFN